jgi:hypothetical protein
MACAFCNSMRNQFHRIMPKRIAFLRAPRDRPVIIPKQKVKQNDDTEKLLPQKR